MPLRNVGTVILLAMAAAKPNVIQLRTAEIGLRFVCDMRVRSG